MRITIEKDSGEVVVLTGEEAAIWLETIKNSFDVLTKLGRLDKTILAKIKWTYVEEMYKGDSAIDDFLGLGNPVKGSVPVEFSEVAKPEDTEEVKSSKGKKKGSKKDDDLLGLDE